MLYISAGQTFFIKGWIVNTLGFMDHRISTLLQNESNHKQSNKTVSMKLYFPKQVSVWIWPVATVYQPLF